MLCVSSGPQSLIRKNIQKIKADAARKSLPLEGRERMKDISWQCKIFYLERFWNGSLGAVGKSLRISYLGSVLISPINAPNKIQSFVKDHNKQL